MQKKFIPIAVFFAALLVFLTHLGTKIKATPVFTYAEEEKCVYLTFDDGPSTVVTNRILDTLKEENIKATFFIVSERACTRKETLCRIAEEGHTVGIHSRSHVYDEIYASDAALLKDIASCAAFIEQTVGLKPTVYRFPGGARNKHMKELVEQQGYRVVDWNASCRDEEIAHADADTLYREAVSSSQGKNQVILLCHDSAYRKTTAEALPRIIAYYREQGYVFRAF